MANRIRVQVVENLPLDAAGLRCLLSRYAEFDILDLPLCEPRCRQSCAEGDPDIILIELSVNNAKSIDCIRQVHARHPDTNILVICPVGEPTTCKMALRAGASGYITKQAPAVMLTEAILEVAGGHAFIEPRIALQISALGEQADQTPFERLSRREHTIVHLILAGESNRDIAERLGIAVSTLANHRAHIRDKLGVSNTVELVRLAMRHGLLFE